MLSRAAIPWAGQARESILVDLRQLQVFTEALSTTFRKADRQAAGQSQTFLWKGAGNGRGSAVAAYSALLLASLKAFGAERSAACAEPQNGGEALDGHLVWA